MLNISSSYHNVVDNSFNIFKFPWKVSGMSAGISHHFATRDVKMSDFGVGIIFKEILTIKKITFISTFFMLYIILVLQLKAVTASCLGEESSSTMSSSSLFFIYLHVFDYSVNSW